MCTSAYRVKTYLIWKPIILWQFHIVSTSGANLSIMLKWVAKVEICWKSTDFLNKLKILWCNMWPYSKLDLKFEFLGQFWYSKVVLRSCFSFRTLSLTCVRFTPKRENFLNFCPNFAITAKNMMPNDFKVILNGQIISSHIPRRHIINGFDLWLHFAYLAFMPLFPPGCWFQPVVRLSFTFSAVFLRSCEILNNGHLGL